MDISLVSMQAIEALFDKKLSAALIKFDERLEQINEKCRILELGLSESKAEIRSLERQLSDKTGEVERATRVNHDRIAALELKAEEQEQYGRRYAVRIEGLAYTDGETNDDIRDQVVDSLAEVGINLKRRDIQRLHRSSAPSTKHGRRVAQTIVKLVHWSARRQLHNINKSLKQKNANFRVYHDLMWHRHALLADARAKMDAKMAEIHGEREVAREQNVFPFVDINSNIHARAGKDMFPIPTASALNDFLERTFALTAFNVHRDA